MFNMLFLCHYAATASMRKLAMAAQDPWGERPDDRPGQQDGNHASGQNGGNKPADQPPDLDELFSRLIGRNRGSGGHGGGDHRGGNGGGGRRRPSLPQLPGMSPKLVGIGVAVLLGLWMASGIYTVQERENGVEIVLGRFKETTGSGLNWNWPFPIGQVEKVDVASIATMRVGEFKTQKGTVSTTSQRTGQMLTRDENIVEIGAAVQYRINDPRQYLFRVNAPVDVLQDIVVSAIREVVGSYDVDEVLRDRRNEWPQQARQIITDMVNEFGLGVEIVAFELQDARAPVEVQDAFEDAVRAREDEERLRLEAEAYANEQIPVARGQAEQMMQQAMAYQAETVAAANASVSRFDNLLDAYQEDKAVMRERLYLETMTDVYAKSRKVVVDAEGTRPIISLGNNTSGNAAGALMAQQAQELASGNGGNSVVQGGGTAPATTPAAAPGNGNDSGSRLRERSRN